MVSRTHIGPYKLVEPEAPSIGGMAQVYRADDPELPRSVAIKEPRPELINPDFLKAFKREAERTALLKHQNIVEVYTSALNETPPYLVLEYLPNSLEDLLVSEDTIPWETAVAFAIQVCDALDFAHKHVPAVIHQDIKPDNLLIAPTQKIKVADFGLAVALRSTPSFSEQENRGAGTPEYMAPEQFLEKVVDGRADIYALGVTLYECISGHPPFSGSYYALGRQHELSPLPELPKHIKIPPLLWEVILTATAKDPGDRYLTADTMADKLKEISTVASDVPQTQDLDKILMGLSDSLLTTIDSWPNVNNSHYEELIKAINRFQSSVQERGG